MDEGIELSLAPESEGRQRLKVVGSLTLPHAAQFKEFLLKSLEEAQEVAVDLQDMTEMDLTALQLLCAAHRSAEKSGKQLAVEGGSAGYRAYVTNAGLKRQAGCTCSTSRPCLWED